MTVDLSHMALISLIFLGAGLIKGIIGMGLPTISLAGMVLFLPLGDAMILLTLPAFITNLWQAFIGQNTKSVFRHIWPFLLCASLTIWLGSYLFAKSNNAYLMVLLGFLLLCYAIAGLARFQWQIPIHAQGWIGPVTGLINGILTGLTGSFVIPGLFYLQALNFNKAQLSQAMGMLFALSSLILALIFGLSLGTQNVAAPDQFYLSAYAIFPAIAGMIIGQKIQNRLSEQVFRRLLFTFLGCLGLVMCLREIIML